MNDRSLDKRKLSGDRVLAECEIVLKNDNPFSSYSPVKKGYIVLNVRGGSLYLPEHFTEENIEKLFPDGKTAEFTKLSLYANNKPEIIIEDLKVIFVRLIQNQNREGVVFSFTEISEGQLDILESLSSKLPAIGPSEEESVPFEEIISLDRNSDLNFQK